MKRKRLFYLLSFLFLIFIFTNLNTIYIAVASQTALPFPPSKAIKEDYVVFYCEESNDMVQLIEKFKKSVEVNKLSSLKIAIYNDNINFFSMYYFSSPSKTMTLHFDGILIEYTEANYDIVYSQLFQSIERQDEGSNIVYRLVNEEISYPFLTFNNVRGAK